MFSFLYSLDILILEFFNISLHNSAFNFFANSLSYLGLVYIGILIAILLYLFGGEKGKHVGKILIVTLILTFFISQIIKLLVMRPRPYSELSNLILMAYESDYSFPSGHTANSTSLAYILGKEYGYSKLFMLIPLFVGISRLYLGVHYPSDVIGGFLVGIIVAYLCEYFLVNKKIFKNFNNKRKT